MHAITTFLASRRYSLTLAALPVVVFFSATAVTKPPQPAPMPVRAVMTEGFRAQRIDAGSFDRRWSPVGQMPPATTVVRSIPSGANEDASAAVAQAASQHPRQRVLTKKTSLRTGLCERHGLRRVVTRGGKSWRCRK